MDNPNLQHNDWKIATMIFLPKKGDLADPNNWQGTTLLDMLSKVVSILLNQRLQNLQSINEKNCQFGATTKLGCQDAVFTLKSFLQERRGKGLDAWISLINLATSGSKDFGSTWIPT